jgi:predicted dehydrogenase
MKNVRWGILGCSRIAARDASRARDRAGGRRLPFDGILG